MREDNLKIEPFEILHLHELKAHQEVNEHGTVTLKGTIHEDKEQEYLALAFKASPMKIFITNHEGLHEIWFDGVITGVEIESDDHFKVITVEAKTGTCLMDVSLHTRTWQEPSLTYSDILSTYTPAYPSGAFIMKEADKSIPGFTMQYRETDWEFSKRMASHFETVLTADFKAGGAKYYFGVPNNSNSSIETLHYKTKRNVAEYKQKSGLGVSISEADTTYNIVRHREVYSLGDKINLNRSVGYVSKIESKLEGQEMYHTYYTKALNGFSVPKCYNLDGTGSSFSGIVTEIKKDEVKVALDIDENKGPCGFRWFPYATPYSTNDGTGWYAMPEKGDKVRVYIPAEDESSAYVTSSVHLVAQGQPSNAQNSPARENPDYKSIMNKYAKEVLFTPNSLTLTNNEGMSIQLLDEEGIKILSDKKIQIQADENINIVSATGAILGLAKEEVLFRQGSSGDILVKLNENIVVDGGEIHLD